MSDVATRLTVSPAPSPSAIVVEHPAQAAPPALRVQIDTSDACARLALQAILDDAGVTVSGPAQQADYLVTDKPRVRGRGPIHIVGDDPIACRTAIEALVDGQVAGIVSRRQPQQLQAVLRALDEGLAAVPMEVIEAAGLAPPLTDRQHQILRLVRTGHTNRQIAERINVSVATVKRDITALLAATASSNRLQLALGVRPAR